MKVLDLIEHLKTLDPDLYVYIDGYEGGLEDLEEIKEVRVMRDLSDVETIWWHGPHDLDSKGEYAIYISRPRRDIFLDTHKE